MRVKDLLCPCTRLFFVLYNVFLFGAYRIGETAMSKKAADLVQIKIRMPRRLHHKLAHEASQITADTINAQIVRRLWGSFQPGHMQNENDEMLQEQARLRAAIEVIAHSLASLLSQNELARQTRNILDLDDSKRAEDALRLDEFLEKRKRKKNAAE